MVEDDIPVSNLFICWKAFRRPRHKSVPCKTFVLKYIINFETVDSLNWIDEKRKENYKQNADDDA